MASAARFLCNISRTVSSSCCGTIPSSLKPSPSGDATVSICMSSIWFRVISGLGRNAAARASADQTANGTGSSDPCWQFPGRPGVWTVELNLDDPDPAHISPLSPDPAATSDRDSDVSGDTRGGVPLDHRGDRHADAGWTLGLPLARCIGSVREGPDPRAHWSYRDRSARPKGRA